MPWPGLKKATLGTEAQGSESFDQATENSQWKGHTCEDTIRTTPLKQMEIYQC